MRRIPGIRKLINNFDQNNYHLKELMSFITQNSEEQEIRKQQQQEKEEIKQTEEEQQKRERQIGKEQHF